MRTCPRHMEDFNVHFAKPKSSKIASGPDPSQTHSEGIDISSCWTGNHPPAKFPQQLVGQAAVAQQGSGGREGSYKSHKTTSCYRMVWGPVMCGSLSKARPVTWRRVLRASWPSCGRGMTKAGVVCGV